MNQKFNWPPLPHYHVVIARSSEIANFWYQISILLTRYILRERTFRVNSCFILSIYYKNSKKIIRESHFPVPFSRFRFWGNSSWTIHSNSWSIYGSKKYSKSLFVSSKIFKRASYFFIPITLPLMVKENISHTKNFVLIFKSFIISQ